MRRIKGLLRLIEAGYWRQRVLPAIRRARGVDHRLRFVARELVKAPIMATYHTRLGTVVCIRHEAIDSFVFEEVFLNEVYAPPSEVAVRLDALDRPARILDLGANTGLFGAYFLAFRPDARVLAYEPDPDNAYVHRRCITLNNAQEHWQLRERFASNREGTIIFDALASPVSRASDSNGPGIEVTMTDVLVDLADADLAKIDVEGAEWPILLDPRLRSQGPQALVLEYHSAGCLSADPASAARDALTEAGYTVRLDDRAESHLGTGRRGLAWAWRP